MSDSLLHSPPETHETSSREGVNLVLGGGGFKGLAHVGVFLALEEQGIPVRSIVGTSAGALMGAAFAHLQSATAVRDLVLGFVGSDDFQRKGFVGFSTNNPSSNGVTSFMSRVLSGIKRQVALERMFRRSSAFGGAALRFVVRAMVPNVGVETLGMPLAIAALDLVKGEEVLITEGPLCSAVCASSSVPGFFPPVERQGRVLVDAGIVNNLPTRLARSLGAQRIVAVDLSAGLSELNRGEAGMDVLLRAQDISTRIANRQKADYADVVLAPNMQGRNWLDPSDPLGVIQTGYVAAMKRMNEIESLMAMGEKRDL
jgi:NTE family protein